MKYFLSFLSLCVLVSLFFCSGCTHLTHGPKKKAAPIITADGQLSEESTSYYYFLEAEINKRKGNIDKALDNMVKAVEQDPESIFLKKELALMYLMANKTDSAMALLESIVAKDPKDIESLIMLGRVKQLLGHDINQIIGIYKKVIALDETQQNIYLLLGNLYLENNEPNNALAIYRSLIDHFPDAYAGYFYIGQIYAEQNQRKKAEQAFLKSIEIEPDLIESRFEMVKLYPDNMEKTRAIYEEIIDIDPENVEAKIELVIVCRKMKDQRCTGKLFHDLSESQQKNNNTMLKIVKVFVETERFNDLLIVLDGMAHLLPNDPETHYFMGMANDKLKNYDQAIKHFQHIPQSSTYYVRSQVHTAFIYHERKDLPQAVRMLENAISRDPKDVDLYIYMGSFHEEMEQFNDALAIFNKGLSISPDNPSLHFYIGVVYDKMGQSDLSLKQMKTVIRLDPDNPNALNYLGYTYADKGIKLDEAEAMIVKALSKKPNDGYITDSLGWVYYQKGMFEKALSYLQKAVVLVPDDPLILEHLGDTYIKLKHKQKALESYHRSLKNNHKDPKAIQLKIERLELDASPDEN